MSERKAWTEMQDSILKQLYETRNIKKWSQIAKTMDQEFHVVGRNGKQCRERYHNHLDDSIKHDKWTPGEERELIHRHDQLGNKWAEISRFLAGRSENDIKNQFYSILRRGLRRVNLIIRKQLKRYKQLQIGTLHKIVEACQKEQRKAIKVKALPESIELKNKIVSYAFDPTNTQEEDLESIKKFIEKVKSLNRQAPKKDGVTAQDNGERISNEVDSDEERDNCPIADIQKQPEPKFRKNSFFNFTLEQPEVEMELKNEVKWNPIPYRMRRRSSLYSNLSFDLNSPKWNEALDPVFKTFQMQQTDNISPKPQFYATSPYFDQSKSGFCSWNPLRQ